jgi:hypothetical protein
LCPRNDQPGNHRYSGVRVTRWPAVHPFLLALLPGALLYQASLGELAFAEFLMVSGIFSAIAAAAVLLSRAVVGSFRRAALLASVFLAGALFYMPLFSRMKSLPLAGATLGHHPVAFVWFGCFVAVTAWWLRRTPRPLADLTTVANVVALGMLLLPAARIGWFHATHPLHRADLETALAPESGLAGVSPPVPGRDIWYVVLDRYLNAATLRERFDFDDREFLDALTATGFYVAERSHSNYPITPLSLASSLNFEYLDSLASAVGENSRDSRPLAEYIRRHKTGTFLRSQGYRYVHSGSWRWPARYPSEADENIAYPGTPLSAIVTLRQTILNPLITRFPNRWLDLRAEAL